MITTILDVQPRVSSGGGGKSNDEIAYELADSILSKLPDKLDIDTAKPELFEPDSQGRLNSLTTVLQQECDRFNKLLNVIKSSLHNLKKAIKGFLVMNDQLEKMYSAFLANVLPELWDAAAYPSLKSLGSWVRDLELRCEFIAVSLNRPCCDLYLLFICHLFNISQGWLLNGMPTSFWLPGIYFPQGFLTGSLQVHARKYDLPIDELSFQFHVLDQYRDQEDYQTRLKDVPFGKKLEDDMIVSIFM